MKRLTTWFLLFLLILNVIGYYGVFIGLQYNNNLSVRQYADNANTGEVQTITFQVPASMPYVPDAANFTSISGQFEHGGEFYQMIMQKYAHDTLTVICILDHQQKEINGVLADYVNSFSDKANHHPQPLKSASAQGKDYLQHTTKLVADVSGWSSEIFMSSGTADLVPTFTSSVIHPPERA